MKHFNQIAFLLSLVINCLSHATPPDLHQAVVTGKLEQVQQVLLYVGLDVNAADRRGNTPLHLAVKNKNEAIVKLLLDAGAKVDCGQKDYTPLFFALNNYRFGMAALLLARGASIPKCDYNY